ncbi:MAG: Sec-independent protein translocase protein TatB [Pseudomonadota bacterium]
MFDIGALELLMIVIVAVLVIGPKDMPAAMRTAGRWIGQVRKVSAHFRTGVDAMVREAELEDMEKKWKARNEEIMKAHPTPTPTPAPNAESAVVTDPSADASADAAGATMTGPPPNNTPAIEAAEKPAADTPADSADKA